MKQAIAHMPTRANITLVMRAMKKLGPENSTLHRLSRETGLGKPTISRARRVLANEGKLDHNKGLITAALAAHLLGVGGYVLRRLVHAGELKPKRVGRRWMFDPLVVLAYRKKMGSPVESIKELS